MTQFRVFLRVALSVGQENKFWDALSGVCGAVILGLFKYVKVLTNLILFWSVHPTQENGFLPKIFARERLFF